MFAFACKNINSNKLDEIHSMSANLKAKTRSYVWLQMVKDENFIVRCITEMDSSGQSRMPTYKLDRGVDRNMSLRFDGAQFRTKGQMPQDDPMFPIKVWEARFLTNQN